MFFVKSTKRGNATYKQPAPENKHGVRSEMRSECIGGKYTQERQSTKQNWKKVNQRLKALEDLPTHARLEIKRLREENCRNGALVGDAHWRK